MRKSGVRAAPSQPTTPAPRDETSPRGPCRDGPTGEDTPLVPGRSRFESGSWLHCRASSTGRAPRLYRGGRGSSPRRGSNEEGIRTGEGPGLNPGAPKGIAGSSPAPSAHRPLFATTGAQPQARTPGRWPCARPRLRNLRSGPSPGDPGLAHVAQLDRAAASDAAGRGFESLRARHLPHLRGTLFLRSWRNGRRAGLRGRWGNPWRFESSRAHQPARPAATRMWRNGRRAGLRIRWGTPRGGSTPPIRTTPSPTQAVGVLPTQRVGVPSGADRRQRLSKWWNLADTPASGAGAFGRAGSIPAFDTTRTRRRVPGLADVMEQADMPASNPGGGNPVRVRLSPSAPRHHPTRAGGSYGT